MFNTICNRCPKFHFCLDKGTSNSCAEKEKRKKQPKGKKRV